uniref:Plexin C1 n=1 Tax=Amazona collaria TaxID=241587 RepID=A0A8B9FHJ7_9PSIT
MAAAPPALSWALPLLAALAGAGGPQSFELPGAPIDNIEVSSGGVLVAGGSCLYELRPELRLRHRVVPAAAGQVCGEPPGMRSNLLLPYVEAGGKGVLLAGWTQKDGTCEVWEQPAYRQRFNRSEVVSCLPDGSTAGVVFQLAGAWYLAVAATYSTGSYGNYLGCEPSQSDKATVITVRSMNNLESKEELGIIKRKDEPLHFVDALQWGDHLFFPYYTLKARAGNSTEPPSMAVLRQLRPSEGGLTLQGHVYLDCGCRTLIVSSSLVRQGERGWWVGVFLYKQDAKAWNATAVCIFGMEEMKEQACASKHFVMNGNSCVSLGIVLLRVCPKLPTLIHSGLVAVYGTVVLNQIVLFLGTDDGQLLKAILNEDMESNCPEILYEIKEETSVFPKLRLDPVDNNYIYLSSANKVRRIPVANCSRYISEQECLSVKDPYCGWCSLTQRCTLKENCTRSNSIKGWYNISHAPDKDLKIQLSFPARNQVCNPVLCMFVYCGLKCVILSLIAASLLLSPCYMYYIHSIEPLWISTLGKSEITVKGENFTRASGIKLILTGITGCKPDIIKVRNVLNDTQMTFALPPTRKEAKSICIQANGKKCSPPMTLHYVSPPSCLAITPNTSWISGGRKITTIGRNFNVVDSVIISDDQRSNLTVSLNLLYNTKYRPLDGLGFVLKKENDNLNISKTEVEVYLSYMNGAQTKKIWFSVQNITKKPDRSTILCKFKREGTDKIDFSTVKVFDLSVLQCLYSESFSDSFLAAFIVTRYKSKELTRKQSQQLELLEYEIRKEIREGFAELQMDELDVVDSFGTVPFLDYKHFALRTFFPESGGFASIFSEDMPQSRDQTSKDESFNMLHALICNKNFLVTLIHTLEKQKNFSVKDRCLFASFLTIALQTKLVYLTHILEVLTKDLMEQSSNVQPKLLLRRTESVVEKLLTNWMSVCLSGFLRETIGEPFYLLVTTLNQRINKGPVDAITCKALYTLNEDWLLWQVSEFKTTVNIIFEKIPENESGDACQTIQVNVLDCDTIGQAKEKSLQAFLNKNGFLYGLQLDEIGLELVSEEQQRELLDIDGSSEVMEDGIRKLNTIGHYEISNGATIKVFKKKVTTRSDMDYSDEHCHLILPDSEANKDVKGAGHKGKQKFKVKEMYLTKLLSTKVAIHSVVEKLFRSIWSLPNNKAPVAIKYFFDFLDAQAESKKITDPDVVHIWKTNSLPLRFWVNILKNPQFVFDIKKTSHIDGCLSVIAQAFMDAFSLAEQTLGKEAPTNKLLYAKDIPHYKEEVKAYYKAIRDLPPLTTSEVEEFLTQESKKHENEFNENVALNEIYRYIAKYHEEIDSKLERERGFEDVQKQLRQVKALFDEKKKCKWI